MISGLISIDSVLISILIFKLKLDFSCSELTSELIYTKLISDLSCCKLISELLLYLSCCERLL